MSRIVITSIQAGTPSVTAMANCASRFGWRVLVVGDHKTPDHAWPGAVDFIGIEAQSKLRHRLAAQLPENHYARKNLGYLEAVGLGAPCIYDTDDDNAPLPAWTPRPQQVNARQCTTPGWVNAYRWFSDEHVWPRGLPLDRAKHVAPSELGAAAVCDSPIQQGLANGSPDVDAVWRLLMERDIEFRDAQSVHLAQGAWCPFNSQSTWWFPAAFPLLYLPSFVSFRMTDIWRSFIAQRCLWAMGQGVVFHGAEVFQDRNPHNLLRDFEQEIPGYLGNERFRGILDALDLPSGADQVGHNLHRCYSALVAARLIPPEELKLVECWLADLSASAGTRK